VEEEKEKRETHRNIIRFREAAVVTVATISFSD
jgi:hypothetical protein